jgi:PPOX class probable F420-dependent enzyme
VELTVMRQRVEEARVARLATVGADGRPHIVPCCFALAGDVLYSVIDEVKPKSTRSLRRLDNIRRNPAVSVLVDNYTERWSELWWVRLDGVAEVIHAPTPPHAIGVGLLADKYVQYRGIPLDGALITMVVERWTGWP